MSNDYCTCYKLKGETDGIKRLAAIVRRILSWRGDFWKNCYAWDPDDIYGVSCRQSRIELICNSVLEDVRDEDIEELPDGKSLWTFWTETPHGPWLDLWQELAKRYVPEAEIYFFAEGVYDEYAYTNDDAKQYFPQDYVLCIRAGSSEKAAPGVASKLCSYLDRPEYRRYWPEESRLCVSYWSVYELQQMFREIFGLPKTALVEAKKCLYELYTQYYPENPLELRYMSVTRYGQEDDPCDTCQSYLALDRENDWLEHQCYVVDRGIDQLRKALRTLQ